MARNAPSRPGLGLSRSGAPRYATGLTWPRRRKSVSPHRSCRSGRGGPRASMRCCLSSICAGCRPAISRRLSPRCWARMHPTCLPPRDRAADGGVADRIRRLAKARSLGPALCVRVGGRRLPAGANGRERRMHACALIGATPEGKKELVGFQTGVRESAQSWRELLIDIRRRGLEIAPDLAIGDGALGFWKAIEEVFPGTRHQRCWVHKTANVLNKVALSVQVNMKADLREIYGAPTRAAAEAAIDVFADKYCAKYDKAVACLIKDRDALLAFFDFPAEHWDHLRTSNPIESVFATVRHR